ncbi:MAG: 16S rRNA (uracil(1498)-N(3))-methyltransferase [Neisseriaceae bacterium]|nr:16S rRNA (uracil(1498)-N(3))-methyltransferase [Neisseriaceae bacterium]
MPRFYIPNLSEQNILPDTDLCFRLPENTVRHINSLRLKNGECITLFDGKGYEYSARLNIQGKNAYCAEIWEKNAVSRESPLHIALIQAVSTGEKMDFTVQKAVELGVNEIYPVVSAHSSVRLNNERAEKRHRRWQEIAISACEQCGRNLLPTIHPIQPLSTLLTALPQADLRLLLAPQGSLKLHDIHNAPQRLTILIGAEGGFSSAEIELAQQSNFQAIVLGKRILRTETAGLSTIAALQTLWGDF